ncbi:MAG: hypothetical protein ACOYMS_05725 [Terrimicrobiaceae bacterium]
MRNSLTHFLRNLLAAAAVLAAVSPVSAQTLNGTYGTGPDTSYLVIQAADFGMEPLWYAFNYTYVPGNPLDGYAMLSTVVAGDPLLDAVILNFGTLAEPNYFVDSIIYNSVTLTNTGAPTFSPYWAQWVSGGEAGYPTPAPIASGAWDFGSGMSAPYRSLVPGAWDGYIFNDGLTAPSITPVPEPGGVWLVLAASGALSGLSRSRTWKNRLSR